MSKRVILSDDELRIIDLAIKRVLKADSYELNSTVGTIGKERLHALLVRLGLEKEPES